MIEIRKKISETIFCALDLETTGTNAALHMIVEVGMVRFAADGIIESYQTLVNPGVKIPGDVTALHGITDEMVRAAPPIHALLGDIRRLMEDALLVIHNPGFDLSFLGWAFIKSGLHVPEMTAVDTVRLARRAWPAIDNYRLETICRHLGLEITPHRAIPDATACMEVFMNVLGQEDPSGLWTINDLVRYHGRLIHFARVKGKRITAKGKSLMGLKLGEKSDITYTDHSGAVTRRTILPIEFITAGGETYVLAHCYLRGDNRFFRMDRIDSIR